MQQLLLLYYNDKMRCSVLFYEKLRLSFKSNVTLWGVTAYLKELCIMMSFADNDSYVLLVSENRNLCSWPLNFYFVLYSSENTH
jgi:hypothetical protein